MRHSRLVVFGGAIAALGLMTVLSGYYLFLFIMKRTKVHMKRLKNKTTSYEPTTHTIN